MRHKANGLAPFPPQARRRPAGWSDRGERRQREIDVDLAPAAIVDDHHPRGRHRQIHPRHGQPRSHSHREREPPPSELLLNEANAPCWASLLTGIQRLPPRGPCRSADPTATQPAMPQPARTPISNRAVGRLKATTGTTTWNRGLLQGISARPRLLRVTTNQEPLKRGKR